MYVVLTIYGLLLFNLFAYRAGTTSSTNDIFYYLANNPLIDHGPWFKLVHMKKLNFIYKNMIVYCFHSIIKDGDVTLLGFLYML